MRIIASVAVCSALGIVETDFAALEAAIQAKVQEQMGIVHMAEEALSEQSEVLNHAETAAIERYKNVISGKMALAQVSASPEEANYLTDRLSNIQFKMTKDYHKQMKKYDDAIRAILGAKLQAATLESQNMDASLFYGVQKDELNAARKADEVMAQTVTSDWKKSEAAFKVAYQKLFDALWDNMVSKAMLAKLIKESKCDCDFIGANDTFWLNKKKPDEPQILMQLAQSAGSKFASTFTRCVLQREGLGALALSMGPGPEWPAGANVYSDVLNCPAGFKQPCDEFIATLKPWYKRASTQVALYTTLMHVADQTWKNKKERFNNQLAFLEQKMSSALANINNFRGKKNLHGKKASEYGKTKDKREAERAARTAAKETYRRGQESKISALACLKLNIAKVAKEGGTAIHLPIDCVFQGKEVVEDPNTGTQGCSKTCGSGTVFKRLKVVQNSSHYGMKCPAVEPVAELCNTVPCAIDCVLGPWKGGASGWSRCSKKCGGGEQYRRRTVEVNAAHGGNKCGPLTQTRDCGTVACARFQWDQFLPMDCASEAYTKQGNCTIGGSDNRILTGFQLAKPMMALWKDSKEGDVKAGWDKVSGVITASLISTGPCCTKKQASVKAILHPFSDDEFTNLQKAHKCWNETQEYSVMGQKIKYLKTERCKITKEWEQKVKNVKYMEASCPKGYFVQNIKIVNKGTSAPFAWNKMNSLTCVKRRNGMNTYNGKCVDHKINWGEENLAVQQTDFKCTGERMIAGFRGDYWCQGGGGLACIRSIKCCQMAFKAPR